MSQTQTPDLLISDADDDTSHVSTPVLPHPPASPSCLSSFSPECTPSPSIEPANTAHLRLPVPVPSANLSQTSFTLIDVSEDKSGVDFDNLPPEVTSADISIARESLCSTSVSPLCLFWRHNSPHIARRTSFLGCFRVAGSKHVTELHRARVSCVPVGTYRAQSRFLSATAASIFGHPFLCQNYLWVLATWVP
jgi:hypothetical protein